MVDVQTASKGRMDRIIKILENPKNTDFAAAMGLLTSEMAMAILPESGVFVVGGAKSVDDRIKNLRELSKQIQKSAEMSRRDFLDFDGPRFQYVFREMLLLFHSSIIKGGFSPDVADHLNRVFCEVFSEKEQRLRQETNKLNPSMMAPIFSVDQAVSQDSNPVSPAS